MTYFSKEFRRLREQSGLTQAEMASALKLSRSAIGMYEQGKREPDFETLEKIADYFNIRLSSLVEPSTVNKENADLLAAYNRLDQIDRMLIYGRILGLLDSDKYKKDVAKDA